MYFFSNRITEIVEWTEDRVLVYVERGRQAPCWRWQYPERGSGGLSLTAAYLSPRIECGLGSQTRLSHGFPVAWHAQSPASHLSVYTRGSSGGMPPKPITKQHHGIQHNLLIWRTDNNKEETPEGPREAISCIKSHRGGRIENCACNTAFKGKYLTSFIWPNEDIPLM